jgi:hypothetical protein
MFMQRLALMRPTDNKERMKMKKRYFQIFLLVLILFLTISSAAAHCEIPCGIYDDEMRVNMIAEHITKSACPSFPSNILSREVLR